MGGVSATRRRKQLRSPVRLASALLVAILVAGGVSLAVLRSRQAPSPSAAPAVGSLAPQIDSLRRHLSHQPHDFRARFRLAQLYFTQKEYGRALDELAVLEAQRPRDAEVFLRRAMVRKYAGQLREAERDVQRALALRPHYLQAREWLGEIYLDQGRSKEALRVFEQCLKERSDSYFSLLGKARALEQLFVSRFPVGPEEIVAPVRRAVELEPNNPWGVVMLARMTFNYLGQADAAEELAQRAARLDPQNPEPHLILAEIALHRPPTPENLRRAGEHALAAGQRDPTDYRPPLQMGRALLAQNEPAEAARLLERSLAIRPMPETVYQLSLAYRRAGNLERARHYSEIYDRWNTLMERRKTLLGDVQREPENVEHYLRLATLYLEAQAPDPAENWLRKARRLRPNDSRVSRLLARVKRLRETTSQNATSLLPIP